MDNVLYRASWQKLRVSTLGQHNPYGGMTTVEGADDALYRFQNYINDVTIHAPYVVDECRSMQVTFDVEKATRIYRVHNFLTSTVNGLISQPNMIHMEDVKEYNDSLAEELNLSQVTTMSNNWDWSVVKTELEILWIDERYWFIAIADDMQERIVEKDKTNDDMMYFVNIMNGINNV